MRNVRTPFELRAPARNGSSTLDMWTTGDRQAWDEFALSVFEFTKVCDRCDQDSDTGPVGGPRV